MDAFVQVGVRDSPVPGGTWKMLLNNTTNYIEPGDIESRAVVVDTSCNTGHQFRVEIEQNGSSWFEYSGWSSSTLVHIDVD